MAQQITQLELQRQTECYRASGGISQENGSLGFRPAFFDTETQHAYLSRFADGRPAPCHLIDGLPEEVVAARDATGHVARLKKSVIAGFLRAGRFYTRDEAASLVQTLH